MRVYLFCCEKTESGGGIYSCELTESGLLQSTEFFPCDRPMYAAKCDKGLCVLLRKPFADSQNSGYFFIDKDLKNPSEIKDAKGLVACHLAVDKQDTYIVNYVSGNIVKNGEKVAQRHGKSVNLARQTAPHTHFVAQTPDGYLAVCDLGTDTLAIYDKDLRLVSEAKVPSGYGIRHLTFSKDGKYIYAVSELVPAVNIFKYEQGKAEIFDSVKIDCKNEKASGAAIRLSDDGKILYVSVREENAICVFAAEGEKLTFLQTADCGGDSPRDFDIIGNYALVTNEFSGGAVVFKLNCGLIGEVVGRFSCAHPLCVVKY